MMRWSRLDIYNATHTCVRHMTLAGKTNYDAIIHVMNYCATTLERRLGFRPYGDQDGITTYYEFEVMVKTDLTMQNAQKKEEA